MKIITKKNTDFTADYVTALYLDKFEHFFHKDTNPLEYENKRAEFESASKTLLLSPDHEQAFLALLIPGLRFTADDQRCLTSFREHCLAVLLLGQPTIVPRKPTRIGQKAL